MNFSTRLRAIIVSTITSVLVFVAMVNDNLFSLQGVADLLDVQSRLLKNFVAAGWVAAVLFLGVAWVLYFKRKGNSPIAIMMFPSVAIFPYVLVADSVVSSINDIVGAGAAAVLASLTYWLVAYLLILTANVLNGALLYDIPLGQAGKAAQFIFSLISLYMLVAFLFGRGFGIEVRVLMAGLFILYFCYSAIWVIRLPQKQVMITSLAISLMMMLVLGVLSVWPVLAIYATLAVVVLMYLLLNIALEKREFVGNVVWLEYILLVVFVLLILLTNANWGINGPLL